MYVSNRNLSVIGAWNFHINKILYKIDDEIKALKSNERSRERPIALAIRRPNGRWDHVLESVVTVNGRSLDQSRERRGWPDNVSRWVANTGLDSRRSADRGRYSVVCVWLCVRLSWLWPCIRRARSGPHGRTTWHDDTFGNNKRSWKVRQRRSRPK